MKKMTSQPEASMTCSCGAVFTAPILEGCLTLTPDVEQGIDKFIREHAEHGINVSDHETESAKAHRQRLVEQEVMGTEDPDVHKCAGCRTMIPKTRMWCAKCTRRPCANVQGFGCIIHEKCDPMRCADYTKGAR